MAYHERLNAIADDVVSGKDQYKAISPHQLLELLRVPRPHSAKGWEYIKICTQTTIEEWVETNWSVIELSRFIEGKVGDARLEAIEKKLAQIEDSSDDLDFSFLDAPERAQIETAIMEQEIDELEGGHIIARICIGTPKGVELWFEGSIEDDGGCIELMSPYDHRDGRFSVVSPISDEWSSASWKDVPTGEVQ
jgi:hypothetical protein